MSGTGIRVRKHQDTFLGFKRHVVLPLLLLLEPQRSEERALDTSLGPDIAFALLVCGFLSFAEQRALLTVCLFSRHSIGPVLLSLSPTVSLASRGVPRGTGTSVLRVVAHDWRCDEES